MQEGPPNSVVTFPVRVSKSVRGGRMNLSICTSFVFRPSSVPYPLSADVVKIKPQQVEKNSGAISWGPLDGKERLRTPTGPDRQSSTWIPSSSVQQPGFPLLPKLSCHDTGHAHLRPQMPKIWPSLHPSRNARNYQTANGDRRERRRMVSSCFAACAHPHNYLFNSPPDRSVPRLRRVDGSCESRRPTP